MQAESTMKRPRGEATHDPNRKTRGSDAEIYCTSGDASGRVQKYFSALLDAALAAIDGMSDGTKRLDLASVSVISCAMRVYALGIQGASR